MIVIGRTLKNTPGGAVDGKIPDMAISSSVTPATRTLCA